MPAFPILNPYIQDPVPAAQKIDDSESEDEFDIDSNVLDAEAQELLKELKALDLTTPARGLANATLSLLETTQKRWSNYCYVMRQPHPEKFFRKADGRIFAGYFFWY